MYLPILSKDSEDLSMSDGKKMSVVLSILRVWTAPTAWILWLCLTIPFVYSTVLIFLYLVFGLVRSVIRLYRFIEFSSKWTIHSSLQFVSHSHTHSQNNDTLLPCKALEQLGFSVLIKDTFTRGKEEPEISMPTLSDDQFWSCWFEWWMQSVTRVVRFMWIKWLKSVWCQLCTDQVAPLFIKQNSISWKRRKWLTDDTCSWLFDPQTCWVVSGHLLQEIKGIPATCWLC